MSLPYSASIWETPELHEARADLAALRARVETMRRNLDDARESGDKTRLLVLTHELPGALKRQNDAEREVLRMRIPYLQGRIEELETLCGEIISYETALDFMRTDLQNCQERHGVLRELCEVMLP